MLLSVVSGGTSNLKDFLHNFFFDSTCVCSKIVGLVFFRELCSVANSIFKCLADLPRVNFLRDMGNVNFVDLFFLRTSKTFYYFLRFY